MGTEVIVALIAAAVAVFSACVAIWGQLKSTRVAAELENLRLAEQRRIDSERTTARYREPLAHAVYDLQSRLYSILKQNLLDAYYDSGDDRSRSYVVDNTTFLIAQYFAWTEVVRREIQYIDLGQDEQTRRLARLRDNIYTLFQTDEFARILRVFAGEQRAIGERMIHTGPRGLECLGYAAFLDRMETGPDRLTRALHSDIHALSANLASVRPRLTALQHALIDLLAFLDPEFIRFPADRRAKVSDPALVPKPLT